MKKYLCILLSALLAACGTKNAAMPVLPDAEAFETTVDGKPVALYTLANGTGFTVQITNFGATWCRYSPPTATAGWPT